MAEVFYQRNQLEQALHHATAGIPLGRQLISARVAQALILGGVRIGRLREHPLDLLADRGVAARRPR